MELVVDKAYYLFEVNNDVSPDKIVGKMNTLSFATHVELEESVLWAQHEFNKWKRDKSNENM